MSDIWLIRDITDGEPQCENTKDDGLTVQRKVSIVLKLNWNPPSGKSGGYVYNCSNAICCSGGVALVLHSFVCVCRVGFD